MNKYAVLKKQVIRHGVIMAAGLVGFAVVFFASNQYAASNAAKKATAETEFTTVQGQIAVLEKQIATSGTAEKRFVEIQKKRNNVDFEAKKEAMTAWLSEARTRYRLSSDLKVSYAQEEPTREKELLALDYTITSRPESKLSSVEAISDVHIYSFLSDLLVQNPGIIRIDRFELTRQSDLNATAMSELARGRALTLVNAEIDFNWISLVPKPAKPQAAATTASGSPK